MKRYDQAVFYTAQLKFLRDKSGTLGRNMQKYEDKILSFKSLFCMEILETVFAEKG